MQFLGASVNHEVMTEKAHKLLPILNIRPPRYNPPVDSPAYPRPCVHEASEEIPGVRVGEECSTYLPAGRASPGWVRELV